MTIYVAHWLIDSDGDSDDDDDDDDDDWLISLAVLDDDEQF